MLMMLYELSEKHEVEEEVGEEVTVGMVQKMLAEPTVALISMPDFLCWQNDVVRKMTVMPSSG
jgi:hypothetical protein